MSLPDSVNKILDFAIGEEEAAVEFYTHLAGRVQNAAMKEVFESFAREEEGHKEKLLAVKAGEVFGPASQPVPDLKIGDYLVDAKPNPDMLYPDALVLAMKKEKAAFKLYTDLAAATGDEDIKAALLGLAQEEARHKLRFELEYDGQMLEG